MMIILGGVYKMGGRGMMDGGLMGNPGVGAVMGLIAWVGVIAVLFSLARLLWKKGDKVK